MDYSTFINHYTHCTPHSERLVATYESVYYSTAV